jgi:hypothetical protein
MKHNPQKQDTERRTTKGGSRSSDDMKLGPICSLFGMTDGMDGLIYVASLESLDDEMCIEEFRALISKPCYQRTAIILHLVDIPIGWRTEQNRDSLISKFRTHQKIYLTVDSDSIQDVTKAVLVACNEVRLTNALKDQGF